MLPFLKVPKCENGSFLFLHHKASKNFKFLIFRGSFGGFFFEHFVVVQAECAVKKFFFQARAKTLNVYVYIWTHLHATRRMFKKFYS
jgi:hypothetical protein